MILPDKAVLLSRDSKIRGGILGLAVADALGVPVEFMRREPLSERPVGGMKGWNIANQAERFVRWLTRAHLTTHNEVFDVGGATMQSIERIS